jgi:hypothetical protein
MFEVNTNIDASRLSTNFLVLIWPKPNCAVGAAKGKKCRWNNNSTKGDIECYHTHHKRKTIHISKSIIFSTTGKMGLQSKFQILFCLIFFCLFILQGKSNY